MMWFLTDVEVKALESGMISADLTRAKYGTSAVPSWAGSLAPLYSVFQVVDGPFFPVTYEDVAGDGRNNNAEFYQLHQNEVGDAVEGPRPWRIQTVMMGQTLAMTPKARGKV